jgi:WD40 repeat protein
MAACLDHEHVAFVGYDSRLLEVWNLRSATRAFTLSQAGKMMGSFIGGSADGRYVTVVDEEGQVTLCDLLTKSVLLRLPYVESGIWSFAWDQSQQLLAVGSVDGGITLWRLDLVRRSLAQMGLDWR